MSKSNDKIIAKKLTNFFSHYTKQTFSRGEHIILPDQEPKGIYLLVEGVISMETYAENGEVLVLNLFKPHSFFPMHWALNNEPNKYAFRARTDVVVWRAPKDEVIDFLQKESDILWDLTKRLLSGIFGHVTQMERLMVGTAEEKLAHALIVMAERFTDSTSNQVLVTLPLTQSELGAITGLSRETVSRELTKLSKQKLVTKSRSEIQIHDLQQLTKRANVS